MSKNSRTPKGVQQWRYTTKDKFLRRYIAQHYYDCLTN
jgi:hypothetical protein